MSSYWGTLIKYGGPFAGICLLAPYLIPQDTAIHPRRADFKAAASRAREQKWQQEERERRQKLGLIDSEPDSQS